MPPKRDFTLDDMKEHMRQTDEMIAESDEQLLHILEINTYSVDGLNKYSSEAVDLRIEYRERCEEWQDGVCTPTPSVISELAKVGTPSQASSPSRGDDDDTAVSEPLPLPMQAGSPQYGTLSNVSWTEASSEVDVNDVGDVPAMGSTEGSAIGSEEDSLLRRTPGMSYAQQSPYISLIHKITRTYQSLKHYRGSSSYLRVCLH